MSGPRLLDQERFRLLADGPVIKAGAWQIASEAASIIDQARAVLASVKEELGQARIKAHEEGRNAGRDEVLGRFAAQLARLAQTRDQLCQDQERLLIDLAVAIVSRIAPALAVEDLVPALASEAVRAARAERYLVVRVAPEALDSVRKAAETWPQIGNASRAEVVADDSLGHQDCVVETEIGIIRAGFGEQLQAIEQALRIDASDPTASGYRQ